MSDRRECDECGKRLTVAGDVYAWRCADCDILHVATREGTELREMDR